MRLEFEKRKRSQTDKDSVTSATKNPKDFHLRQFLGGTVNYGKPPTHRRQFPMPQSHGSQYKRKPTGGTKRAWRGKRAYEAGSEPTETTLGPARKRWVETRGGGLKVRLAAADWAVVTDKTSGKSSK